MFEEHLEALERDLYRTTWAPTVYTSSHGPGSAQVTSSLLAYTSWLSFNPAWTAPRAMALTADEVF